MKIKMGGFRKGLLIVGICVLAIAVILLITSLYSIQSSERMASSYVSTIKTLLPEPQGAALEENAENDMPALSIEGKDFIGIIEMPSQNSVLPVGAQWKTSNKYPCRFSGSVYDGSIQIGASTHKGQYDFYREISVGDKVYFTDMSGNRYGYTIKAIRYEKHADQDALNREESNLTLFVKNMYGFDYIIVYCD